MRLRDALTEEGATSFIAAGLNELREARHRERFAFALFCLTVVHCTLLFPEITLVPGERTKLFTALICGVCLVCSLPLVREKSVGPLGVPILVTGLLALLLLIGGGRHLPALTSPFFRGIGVVMGCSTGFFCARIHLRSPGRQALFTALCLPLLVLVACITILGVLFKNEDTAIHQAIILHSNPHDVVHICILLSFAPLTLLMLGGRMEKVLGWLGLGLCYLTAVTAGIRTAVFAVPILGGFSALMCHRIRVRHFLMVLGSASLVTVLFFYILPGRQPHPSDISVWFRAENYPFSLHISMHSPIVGIGLRAPRMDYLEGYKPHFPELLRPGLSGNQKKKLLELDNNLDEHGRQRQLEQFAERRLYKWVSRTVTSENMYLTAIADTGWVTSLVFFGGVGLLLVRMIRNRQALKNLPIPPAALSVPVFGALTHYMVYDGLLHVQMAFIFCVILGIMSHNILSARDIPRKGTAAEKPEACKTT